MYNILYNKYLFIDCNICLYIICVMLSMYYWKKVINIMQFSFEINTAVILGHILIMEEEILYLKMQ